MIACLLLAALLFALLPGAGAEETRVFRTSDAEKYLDAGETDPDAMMTFALLDQLGADMEVEIRADGSIVSVNGYPYRTVEADFNVHSVENKVHTETDWVDYPFWRPATQYDGNLANMSLIMAICSARDRLREENPKTFDPAQNVEAYLRSAGFTDIRKDDYSKETSIYTISTAIGARRMEHGDEEPFTLIAVSICGGAYKNEWQSNISAGSGEMHEGFRSASDLVIDRIAGYITTRGIKGRIKLWLSGFSRAAAVANLTAGRLTRAGAFAKEDVYAYTFATPAAVLNPPETGDENIFNILCPTDVVPQTMPREWSFGRFGKDLWLPVQEFSAVGELAALLRENAIRESFGIDIHYSAALNLRMRLLFSMVIEAIGSPENYAENIQDAALGVMQKMDTSNLIATMRQLMLSVKDGGAETRDRLDGLMNFVVRVFGNALTRTELAEVNSNSGSTLFLLFTEHREDSYLGSMDMIRAGLFEDTPEFTYVMVRGPVNLMLEPEDGDAPRLILTEKGTLTEKDPQTGTVTENPDYREYYLERIGGTSIAAIPGDARLRVRWEAVSDGTVEVLQARCGLHVTSRYPGAATDAVKVTAGDAGTAWAPEHREGILPEGFRAETWEPSDLARFLGIAAPPVSWRILTTALILVIGLVIFLVIRLAALFFPNKKKNGTALWILLAVFCVAVAEAEGCFWLMADRPWVQFLWKAAAGAAVVAVFFLRHEKAGKLWDSMLPGLAVMIAGDLAMTFFPLAGLVPFLAGHVLLVVGFLKRKSMNRYRWLQWGLLSVPAVVLMILVFVPRAGFTAWMFTVYMPVLLLIFYCTSGQAFRIRYATAMLLFSDLLLGAWGTVWKEPMAHILSTFLLAASLMLLARIPGDEHAG